MALEAWKNQMAAKRKQMKHSARRAVRGRPFERVRVGRVGVSAKVVNGLKKATENLLTEIKSTISRNPPKRVRPESTRAIRRAPAMGLLWVLAIGLATTALPRGAYAGDSAPAPVGAGTGETRESPDNSGTNVRDRDAGALTPMDQGNSAADVAITQQIRKAVMAQDGLSVDAKNVKIITNEGVVTLRGPVKTAKEKVVIEALATKTGGVKKVDDQLEVETKH